VCGPSPETEQHQTELQAQHLQTQDLQTETTPTTPQVWLANKWQWQRQMNM